MINSNSHPGHHRTRLALGSLVILGTLAMGLAAPGAFGAQARSISATTAIKTNWTLFFKGTTPAAEKEKLLQDGSKFAVFLKAQAKSSAARATTVKVTKVKLLSNTKAKVTYTIYINGSPAEPNATGTAVLHDGTWLVSKASFCALVSLEGASPGACK